MKFLTQIKQSFLQATRLAEAKTRRTSYKLQAFEGGYALLLAVLITSVTLTVGLAIFDTSYNQLLLSALGEESNRAFFAADTGTECALYHDLEGEDVFATSTDSLDFNLIPLSGVFCENIDIAAVQNRVIVIDDSETPNPSDDIARTTFAVPLSDVDSDRCAEVIVTKNSITDTTTIESSGFNTGIIAPDSLGVPRCVDDSNPRRVQRSIRVTY